MSVATALVVFFWGLHAARVLLASTAFWQVKEYRLDRAWAHWRMPGTLRRMIHPLGVLKVGMIVLLVARPGAAAVLVLLVALVYLVEGLGAVLDALRRRTRRPKRTLKALGIMVVSGVLAALAVTGGARGVTVSAPTAFLEALLVTDLALPTIVAFVVAVFAPLSFVAKQRIISRARAARAERADLTVIGITGSYGKTSTKEILTALLGDPGAVIATPGNTNTEIGVAQFFLRSVRPHHRVVICEMGAYRRGEIRRIAEIVRPTIGILTAVGPQHLALFGSLEAIRETKCELIDALPRDGTAIVNADDPICADVASRVTTCQVVRTGAQRLADIRASQVMASPDGLTADLHTPEGMDHVVVPLLGEHQMLNVLLAVAAARALGVTQRDIVERLRHLHPIPRTMEPLHLRDGTLVIDDSYSANPDGVIAAVRTLRVFPQRKNVVVLAPLIELGRETASSYGRIGAALAESGAHVYLTENGPITTLLHAGVKPAHPVTVARESRRLLEHLERARGPDTVVLLEGRVPTVLWEAVRADAQRKSDAGARPQDLA